MSDDALVSEKPLPVPRPRYNRNARYAGRAIAIAIAFNIVVVLITRTIEPDTVYAAIAIASRLVIVALVVVAFRFAIRGIGEISRSHSKVAGTGEAVAAIVIGSLATIGAIFTIVEAISLLL